MLDAIFEGLISPFVSIDEFIAAGGWILPWIFLAGLVMWTLIMERYWFFFRILPRERAEMLAMWKQRPNHKSWASRHIRQELISRANAQMRATLPLLKVLVPLCPLLGLLGTVTGMLEVFDAMAARGYADARTMAYGVSHAMISTMAGLVVSMSGIFFVGRFATRTRVQTELLADALSY